VSTTVRNEQIAKLPLSGRDVLGFALLTPGAATSSGSRFSTYNGLPGGAINITLDGVNDNSQRFRSGGTSFFVFAPIRLGAVEEVTVSTAGLTAEAGAEGAVQVQFSTKRGTNAFRGQGFDTIQNEKLNAQLATINGVLGKGTLSSLNLVQDTFNFIYPNEPNVNVYPTGRVDYRVKPSLSLRGVLNLQYRNLPRNPQYPGLDPWNSGFKSN